MKKLFILLLIITTACNTVKSNKENKHLTIDGMSNKNIVVLKINANKIDCYGVHGKQKCLQIKELGIDREWQNLYEGIEGFSFIPGFVYTLQVEKIELQESPQDASSIIYKLKEMLKKEKIITNEELIKYPVLEVTKIYNGKDGYIATLKDVKGGLFTCTISIPNMEDNYVQLKVGDKAKIAGEYAESNPVQIFAKRILKIE